MKNTAPVLAFVFLVISSPTFGQTTCADGYALCMSGCNQERCMQTCQGKRDVCMTTGTLSTGHQTFRGLQRTLEESPAISAWDLPRETPPPLRRDGPASGSRRSAR
jgi:hypothetical protein